MEPCRRSRLAALLAAAAATALAACGKEATPFAPGLEPLESTERVVWPAPTATDPYPEVPSFEDGGGQPTWGGAAGYSYGLGRAWLKAPLATTWAALQIPPGVLLAIYPDRDGVDCGFTPGVEPEYAVSFRLRETPKNDGPVGRANWFDVTWRAGATAGTAAAPLRVNVRYQKTDGSSFIRVMAGSVVATEPVPGVTALEFVRHINAPGEDGFEAADWIRLYYEVLRDHVHGTSPPPNCGLSVP
jgi:hypothetical protein